MTTAAPILPAFADVLSAAARIAPHAHRTPVLRSQSLDDIAGCALFFKCENLQRVGAFKFRGACNAIFALDDATAARGILTQSSGNHGAAVALASRLRGVSATVVVPEGAPAVKLAAIAGYGARIVRCAPTMAARNTAAAAWVEQSGAHLVHPFDDAQVIAGQGTVAMELLRSEAGLVIQADLAAQCFEVARGLRLVVAHAMEGAERAEDLAERHVHVELARARRRRGHHLGRVVLVEPHCPRVFAAQHVQEGAFEPEHPGSVSVWTRSIADQCVPGPA